MKQKKGTFTSALKYSLCSYVKEYLTAVIHASYEGRFKREIFGLDTSYAAKLCTMTPLQLDQFCAYSTEQMICKSGFPLFCLATLNDLEARLNVQKAEQTLIDDFVSAGATQEMLHELFGLRRVEISALRSRLQLNTPIGRPKAPTEQQIQRVEACWSILPSEIDPRFRIYLTHRDSAIDIQQVWSVLRGRLRLV